MRIAKTKFIPVVDVGVTSNTPYGKVRLRIFNDQFENNKHGEITSDLCLTKEQTTQLIAHLKSQRARLKCRKR